jgi:hypothetical protein
MNGALKESIDAGKKNGVTIIYVLEKTAILEFFSVFA